MSLGIIEYDATYESAAGPYSTKQPALTVRAKGLVASFKEAGKKIQGEGDPFSGQKSTHYEADPGSTAITLLSGEAITVPLNYDQVDFLLAKARQESHAVNFRQKNWETLKAEPGVKALAGI